MRLEAVAATVSGLRTVLCSAGSVQQSQNRTQWISRFSHKIRMASYVRFHMQHRCDRERNRQQPHHGGKPRSRCLIPNHPVDNIKRQFNKFREMHSNSESAIPLPSASRRSPPSLCRLRARAPLRLALSDGVIGLMGSEEEQRSLSHKIVGMVSTWQAG